MRKITQQISNAFHTQQKLSISNTVTDGESVWLFGNKIIERKCDGIYFSLAGWNTVTTRERINGILKDYIQITSCNGQPYILYEKKKSPFNSTDWIRTSS